jgi:tetratricopeptide (TPR) repeat protein
LQGNRLSRDGTQASNLEAIAAMRKAVSIDPKYVDAWRRLGSIFQGEANQGLMPFNEGCDLAEQAFARALAIDPRDAGASCGLAEIKWWRRHDIVGAAAMVRDALSSNPTDERCLDRLARLRSYSGRFDGAIQIWQQLHHRDPLSPVDLINIALARWAARQWDESITAFSQARSLSGPGVAVMNTNEAFVRVFRHGPGDLDSALTLVQREPVDGWRLQGLAVVQHAFGNRAASDAALNELIEKHARGWPYNIAEVLAMRGDSDGAFKWLDAAMEYGDAGLVFVNVDPMFSPLHRDARWLSFLRKIGQSPEVLAKLDLDYQGQI